MNCRKLCCKMLAGWILALGALSAHAIPMPPTGLKVWLKAAALTGLTNGEPVGVWTDISGNGNNATNGGVLRPAWQTNVINGMPAVRFDGITNYLQNAAYAPGANDVTLVLVARRNGSPLSGYHNIFIGGPAAYKSGTGSPGSFYQIYADGPTLELRGNLVTIGAINSGVKFTNTTFQILCLWKSYAASSNEFFINGTSRGTKAGAVVAGNKFYIGNWNNNPMNGDIAEAALYNTALSIPDRQLVEGRMAWTYGLQANLPAGHPWKDSDPTREAPSLFNAEPASVSSSNATLVGHLASTGTSAATVSVFWGAQDGGAPTSGLWQYTNTFAPGAWADDSYPATNVILPTPFIFYYYRFYATNATGDAYPLESQPLFARNRSDWIQAAPGTHDWTNSANWSPAIVPNAAYALVTITNDRASNQTINVHQAITLGELVIGNTNTITLTPLTGGNFRFDNGSLNPRIVSTNATFNNYVDITYGSGAALEVSNSTAMSLFGTLGGFRDLVKQGAGVLLLYGNNTYTGNFIVAGSGEIQTGSGTPPAGAVIPNAAWLELTNNAIFKIGKSDQFFQGLRGIGLCYVNNDGSIVIGTNRPAYANYTTRVVEGGKVSPGFGAEIGDLYLNNWSTASYKAQIQGGDLYIDVTGSNTYDRILFKYGANEISGGNLHLAFLSGYTPAKGASWSILVASNGGTISDTNGGALFDSIDANISGFTFYADIVSGNTVRISAMAKLGAVIIIR